MVNKRIPLLCLDCGNAVVTPRDLDHEIGAMAIAMHGCNVCDNHGEGHETFYLTRSGETLSFGEWMDRLAWAKDCLEWRGRMLTGKKAHWCPDWDLLPIDETTSEWPCQCKIGTDALTPPPPKSRRKAKQ